MILGYFFSLLAAFLWGTNHVLIRLGVTNITTPLVGATLATLTGALMLSAVSAKDYGTIVRSQRMGLLFMALAGATAAMGLAFQFMAFSLVPVFIASPLSCTYPVITAALARFFLKRTETVTPRVILGAFCVVVGGTLIALGRP